MNRIHYKRTRPIWMTAIGKQKPDVRVNGWHSYNVQRKNWPSHDFENDVETVDYGTGNVYYS